MQFSKLLASSDLVPKDYKGKPANILVAVQWGQEIGLQPLQALQNISVIGGRPAIWGDAALALCRADPRCLAVQEEVSADTATCKIKRRQSDGSVEEITRSFTSGDAKRAGLLGKQGPWQNYPKRMLQMRARGFAIRDAFPDLLRGVITAEEAQDYPDASVPPANPLDDLPAIDAPEPEVVVREWDLLNPANGSVLTSCDTEEEFVAAASAWIATCRRSKKGQATGRRHSLSELKKGNPAWEKAGSEALEKRYLDAIKLLSVQGLNSFVQSQQEETPDAGNDAEAV
tara:strand:- start:1294 stop:2151 length:858 start_codon:yes stop_codon:yes gene_type:complete